MGFLTALRRWHLPNAGWFWLFVAAITVFAGWFKTINLLLLLGYTMFGLLGINALVAYAMARRVSATRVSLPPGFAGTPVPRAVDVRNSDRRQIVVGIEDNAPVAPVYFFLPNLGSGETRRVGSEILIRRRGRYPIRSVSAVSAYPFGLIQYTRPLTEPEDLVVLPPVGQVDFGRLRKWLVRTGAGDSNARRPINRGLPSVADVRGVRPYRAGDSPRDVHWRTTARRGSLMVREYDSTSPLDLILVFEPHLPDDPTPADRAKLERAVELAASVFWAWCRADDTPEATLIVTGTGGGIKSGRGSDGFARQALGMLAGVTGSHDSTTLPADWVRTRSNRSARLLVSSRHGSPLFADLRRRAGLPFVPMDPATVTAWYIPPLPDLDGPP